MVGVSEICIQISKPQNGQTQQKTSKPIKTPYDELDKVTTFD